MCIGIRQLLHTATLDPEKVSGATATGRSWIRLLVGWHKPWNCARFLGSSVLQALTCIFRRLCEVLGLDWREVAFCRTQQQLARWCWTRIDCTRNVRFVVRALGLNGWILGPTELAWRCVVGRSAWQPQLDNNIDTRRCIHPTDAPYIAAYVHEVMIPPSHERWHVLTAPFAAIFSPAISSCSHRGVQRPRSQQCVEHSAHAVSVACTAILQQGFRETCHH